MGWNEERIATLRTLWAEGLSASRIADQLGGVSRNAVLGKVWRLKLTPRATTAQFKPGVPNRQPIALPFPPSRRQPRRVTKVRPRLRLFVNRLPIIAAPPPIEDIPPARLVPLLRLKADMCRWPYGEPKTPGFGFCGRTRVPGFAYCPCHVQAAHQPARARPRSQDSRTTAPAPSPTSILPDAGEDLPSHRCKSHRR